MIQWSHEFGIIADDEQAGDDPFTDPLIWIIPIIPKLFNESSDFLCPGSRNQGNICLPLQRYSIHFKCQMVSIQFQMFQTNKRRTCRCNLCTYLYPYTTLWGLLASVVCDSIGILCRQVPLQGVALTADDLLILPPRLHCANVPYIGKHALEWKRRRVFSFGIFPDVFSGCLLFGVFFPGHLFPGVFTLRCLLRWPAVTGFPVIAGQPGISLGSCFF